jgi:hypothetical protein
MFSFDPQTLRVLLAPESSPLGIGLQRLAPIGHEVARWCERPRAIPRRVLAILGGGGAAIVALRLALAGAPAAGLREVEPDYLVRPALTPVTAGFERNAGQAAADVRYLAQVPGARVLVTDGELRLIRDRAGYPAVRLQLDGVDARSRPRADEPIPEQREYRMSPLDEGVITAEAYGRVEYRDLYPGVDLALAVGPEALQLRFRVDHGASAAPVRLSIDRATLARDDDGVRLGQSGLRIDDASVQAYAIDGTHRYAVPVHLVLEADGRIGLDLGPHDVRRAIDVVIAIRAARATPELTASQTVLAVVQ